MDWTFLLHLFVCLGENTIIFSSQTRLHVGWTVVLTHNLSFVLLFVFDWSANLFEISWLSWQQHLPRRWSFLTQTSSKNAASSSQLELEKWEQQNLLHAPKFSFSSANMQQGSAPLNGEKKYAGSWEREDAVLSWMVWYTEGECYSCFPKTTALFLIFSFSQPKAGGILRRSSFPYFSFDLKYYFFSFPVSIRVFLFPRSLLWSQIWTTKSLPVSILL